MVAVFHILTAHLIYIVIVTSIAVNKTKQIKLGALYSVFNPDGSKNEAGAQGLAGFLMAVDEINRNPDILPDYYFDFIVADPLEDDNLIGSIDAAIKLATVAFGSGVDLVIGGVGDYQTINTNTIFNNYAKIQISSIASSDALAIGADFPYKFRMYTSEAQDGLLTQYWSLYHMGYTRVVTIRTVDSVAAHKQFELSDNSFASPIFLDEVIVDATRKRFTKFLLRAKATGARVFIIFADAATTGRLLEQGYNLGVFHSETIIFGGFENSGPDVYKAMTAGAPVEEILKGYFALEFVPNYSIFNNDSDSTGQQWFSKWIAQSPTLHGGVCSNRTDFEGSPLLARNVSGTAVCAGYNFSAFGPTGADLHPNAPYSYDAVYASAYGLHSLLYVTKGNLTTDQLHLELSQNVAFNGATGYVEFIPSEVLVNGEYVSTEHVAMNDDGVISDSISEDYTRGDREAGHHYKIVNFNAAAYRADNVTGGFVQVGIVRLEDRFQFCGDDSVEGEGAPYVCTHDAVYRSLDNTRPTERPPDSFNNMMEDSQQVILIVFIVFGFIVVATTSAVLFVKKGDQLVRSIQPPMIALIMFGMLAGLCRAIIPLFPISDDSCRAEVAVGHLAFFVVFVSLYVKTWRINRLMVTTTFKKIKITNMDAVNLVLKAVACLLLLLVIVLVVGDARVASARKDEANQLYFYLNCLESNPGPQLTLVIIELIILLMGASLARTVSELPGAVNESKNVLVAMLCIVVIGGVVFPISMIGLLDVIFSRFVTALSFAIAVLLATIFLYGSRVYYLCKGNKMSKSFRIANNDGANNSEKQEFAVEERRQLLALGKAALKAIPNEEGKIELCAKQIEVWYAYLSVLSSAQGEQKESEQVSDMVQKTNAALASNNKRSKNHVISSSEIGGKRSQNHILSDTSDKYKLAAGDGSLQGGIKAKPTSDVHLVAEV